MSETKTVIVASKKSIGLAFLLTFLFGPFGMLYSTVPGAIIMLIVTVVLGITTIIGLIPCWIICIIWGMVAADSYNKKLLASANSEVRVS